ncbi:Gfo/Idh/MocA family protein [Gryllotalpicola protaetiae]|uniref:Gfo/Idh/MocA family oxidoreductase n=1 Tax=Gryllotalpicola protaetiae TaxID=2419771 RepID=A0A387BNA8_9MICO|nr:Gfo/Idh/MocA family oxidoreductase [Gryllotalpicola protaetiae]AYG03922.1 gfo/Idh/MocA family oxidoreductase [Gryllotalpicola protaetiae]
MRVGIISFAHTHASSYAQILRDRPDVECLATDPDFASRPAGESGGRELAEKLGIGYVDTVEALLDWHPDAVIVCSENARHADYAVLAAAAGANVLCEKPLATTREDAHRIIEACEQAGVVLMTAFPVRFTPEYAQLRDHVRAGALGRVLSISGANNGKLPSERAWFADPALAGGGAVADHTVHIADLVFGLFPGIAAEEVFAVANHQLHPERAAETAGLVSIRYSNGVTVTIDCSWSVPDHYPTWGGLTIRVIAEQGIAELAPFAARIDGFGDAENAPLWLPYGTDLDAAMLDEFLNAVAEGRAPTPSGVDGLRALEVVLAAYESISTRRPAAVHG